MVRRAIQVFVFAAAGASPGTFLAVRMEDPTYAGVAILGGLIGLGLGISSSVYRTDLLGSTRRVMKGLAYTLLNYNVGTTVAEAVRVDNEPAASDLQRDSPLTGERARLYWKRFNSGSLYGSVVLGTAGFITSWTLRDADDDSVFQRFVGALVFLTLGVAIGIVYGAAIAVLTVRGRHRIRIMIGTLAGSIIGFGLAVAVIPEFAERWERVCIILAMFASAGLGAGLFARESLPADDQTS